MALRVGLADDSLLIREALTRMLDSTPGIELVAACEDGDALMEVIEREPLDVVLLDVCMPPTMSDDGIRLAAELRESHPRIGVVILSAYCEPAYALGLLAGGSDGRAYLLKDRLGSRPQLVAAIETVAAGGSVIDPKVVEALVHGEPGDARSLLATLSPREHEVLVEMARGASNAAIAEELGLTKRAVEKHINSVFAKLELPVTPDVSRRVRAVLLFLAESSTRARV